MIGPMRLLTAWLLSAAALAVAAGLLGEHMNIGEPSDPLGQQLITLGIVAAIFTAINLWIAPIIKALSLPFIIVTLGLMLWIINALLLLLTEALAGAFDQAFVIDGFGWALLGALVISVVNAVLGVFFSHD